MELALHMYNVHRNFSLSNLGKKCTHYTRQNTVHLYSIPCLPGATSVYNGVFGIPVYIFSFSHVYTSINNTRFQLHVLKLGISDFAFYVSSCIMLFSFAVMLVRFMDISV